MSRIYLPEFFSISWQRSGSPDLEGLASRMTPVLLQLAERHLLLPLGYMPPAPEVIETAKLAGSAPLVPLATLRPPAGTAEEVGLT